jgi:TatD DNase family protein
LDKVAKNIPLDHLVLETDAPYLAPTPFRGKRNESAYIHQIADKLASIKEVELEELARITSHNAEILFS